MTLRVVSMNNGRTWHSVLADNGATIVAHCGIEMARSSWQSSLQTEDKGLAPNCKRCEPVRRRNAEIDRASGPFGQPKIVRAVSDPPPLTPEDIKRLSDEGAALAAAYRERTRHMEDISSSTPRDPRTLEDAAEVVAILRRAGDRWLDVLAVACDVVIRFLPRALGKP